MKPRTYLGLALLIPYILWGICVLIVFLLRSQEISEPWNIVLMPISFYAFGILLWFIPYTILAIGMWIWSRNKSTDVLRRSALFAPLLLFALMLIEVMLVSLSSEGIAEMTNGLLGQSALVGGFSLVFGYLCVGIAIGLYKFLLSKNIIKETTTLNNASSPSAA